MAWLIEFDSPLCLAAMAFPVIGCHDDASVLDFLNIDQLIRVVDVSLR